MKNLSKTLFMLLGVTIAVTFSGCSDEESGPKPKEFEPIPISRSEETIVRADNNFAYKFFEAVDERAAEHENYVMSPLSVSMTLAMTANGASGETLDEMLDVLGFKQQDIAGLNTFYKKMLDRLPALDNTTAVDIANALWINKKYTTKVYDVFSGNIRDSFYSPITYIDDITSDITRQSINKWYSDNTRGMLSGPRQGELNMETAMLFTNALYFKGFWADNFDKSLTKIRDFKNSDGTVSKVKMMNKAANFRGYIDEGYRAVAFPYGNKAYSMIIILPDEEVDLDDCLSEINPEDVSRLAMDKYDFGEKKLLVRLPKFEVTSEVELIPALKDMGLTKMFDCFKADFSGICETSTFVSQITQGIKIIVDEAGTEAASYTEEKGMLTSPGPMIDESFFVDRPFAFIIAEKSTGLPLFMGRINKL
ncbi:MAG: serpin family protein [Muribaculaceae bacterium]|jgi:serpin B|nr:serpin family protein [Muribaculaceae bacterium]